MDDNKPTAPPQYAVVPQMETQPLYAVQPTVVMAPMAFRFGEFPVQMQCPNCHNMIVTRTTYDMGALVWLAALGLFFVTLCCCWIAFIIDGLKDVVHTCPQCHTVLGRYNRI